MSLMRNVCVFACVYLISTSQPPSAPPPLAPVCWCSETTAAATQSEAPLIQTLATGCCPASRTPCLRWPPLSPRLWSPPGLRLKTPSRVQTRPPNPNCGPWWRSPHRQTEAGTAEGRGHGRALSTPHPPLGPCSPMATPCPDTCTTPPPSCTDTRAMAP